MRRREEGLLASALSHYSAPQLRSSYPDDSKGERKAPPGEGGAVVCELMSVNERCRATAVPYRGGGSSRDRRIPVVVYAIVLLVCACVAFWLGMGLGAARDRSRRSTPVSS